MASKINKRRIPTWDGNDSVHIASYNMGSSWTDTTVSSSQSDPSGSEGSDVSNAEAVTVICHTLNSITAYAVKIWVKGGSSAGWAVLKRYEDNSTVAFTSLGSTTFAAEIPVPRGADRLFAQVTSVSGTSLIKSVKVV